LSEGAAYQSAPESKDPALPHIADEITVSLETMEVVKSLPDLGLAAEAAAADQ